MGILNFCKSLTKAVARILFPIKKVEKLSRFAEIASKSELAFRKMAKDIESIV